MGLSTLQIVISVSMVGIAIAGILFIVQDARAHRRHMNEYASRKGTPTYQQEHEIG